MSAEKAESIVCQMEETCRNLQAQIGDLRRLLAQGVPEVTNNSKPTTHHIVEILRRAERPMKAREVYDELVRAGRAPHSRRGVQSVRVSLLRLARSEYSPVSKVGEGEYTVQSGKD